MKMLLTIVRIFVGVLFIFSGLVKANDPLGLSYKIQEFFEIGGLHAFNEYTLVLSILLNAFEIIAGVALLVRWQFKLTGWLLLLLIIFFTALTGYTYWTGLPKNCGCFGDCLPISSQFSFIKDVVLLVLICFLLVKHRILDSCENTWIKQWGMTISFAVGFGLQVYALLYLPPVDCLPFKKGNDIVENLKTPTNAIPDSTVIVFTYRNEGKEIQFLASEFPADFNANTYQFVRREDKLIRQGKNNEPPIKGFVLNSQDKVDSTQFVLDLPLAILVINEKAEALLNQQENLQRIRATTLNTGIPSFIISSAPEKARNLLSTMGIQGMSVFSCDLKAIQTAARVNPTYYLLKKGVILQKVSGRQIEKLWETIESVSP
jgi:uncharacterized membrane protein YphA (DoxX/SURF4 family)